MRLFFSALIHFLQPYYLLHSLIHLNDSSYFSSSAYLGSLSSSSTNLMTTKHFEAFFLSVKLGWGRITSLSDKIGVFYHIPQRLILTVIYPWEWPCEVQESSRDIPAHLWSKNISEIGHIEEDKRNSFTLPTSPFPQGSRAECQERPSWFMLSAWEKVEQVSAQLPQMYKRTTSFSIPNTE